MVYEDLFARRLKWQKRETVTELYKPSRTASTVVVVSRTKSSIRRRRTSHTLQASSVRMMA